MKAQLYLELPSEPGMPLRIARWRGGRLERLSPEDLKVSGEPRAIAFAPALSVARFRIPLAARSESEARRAALYAVEDELAQSIDDVHLTLGPRDSKQTKRDLYVVDKQLLNAWSSELNAMGIGHAEIVPETSLNPAPDVVLDFGDRLLLNGTMGVIGADPSWPHEAIRELISASGLDGVLIQKVDALETLSKLHNESPGISLKNTVDAHTGRTVKQRLRPWTTVAVLGAVAAFIWIASIWAETANLQRLAGQHELTSRELFRAQFPTAADPVDIHAEVRRLSLQLGPGAAEGFRSLLTALYAALADSSSTRLARLSYSAHDAVLEADLQFANRADEAAFQSRIELSGHLVEVTDLRESPGGISATVMLRARS
jgi:general secretion pathway protein L